MDHVVPEVDLVDVLIAGTALFPGDSDDDPPMVMRDLPILVVAFPWEEVQESMNQWGLCDLTFGMVVTPSRATIQVTLYDPYVSFRIRVPLPDWDDAILLALESGWLGIQSDDGLNCVLVSTSRD